MIQTFVFIFYMAVSIVPAKNTQFQMKMYNPENDKETVILDFKRDKDQWSVVPNHTPNDVLYFRFNKQYCYIKEGAKGKEKEVDLLTKMEIKANHKKWGKVSQVEFRPKEKEGKVNNIVFDIEKKGKKKRMISLNGKTSPNMSVRMPKIHLSWK